MVTRPEPLERGAKIHVGVCSMCDRAVVISASAEVVAEWTARHLELMHPADPLGGPGTPPLRC